VTDWTALPGFPRTFASQCAPWGSSVRFVNGAREMKAGKSVTISGAKAFLQRLEIDLISGRAATPDIPTLINNVLDSHARHIDSVEWCRVRDQDVDLCLRVYATRGAQRLHLSLLGPIGRHADQPLPVHALEKPAKRAKPGPPAPPPALPAREPVPPPSSPLLLRPIAAGARPSYSDPIARDLDGRLHVTVRLPDRDAYACVEPTGAVTLTPLLTRDVLRETDNAAMTGAMNASVYTTAAGLVRIDHYESSNISQERVGHAGRWVSGRRGLWSADWTLGMFGDWFCRVIINNDKPILLGVNLATGKRTRIALPPGDDHVRGAAVDRTDHGDLLRLLHGACELRLHLRAGKTLEVEPTFSVPHTLAGAMHPVPNTGGWLVAADRTLQFIRPDLPPITLFTLPPSFTGDYAPWGAPKATLVGFTAPHSWLTEVDFGADDRPRCRGALVFTADGAVRNLAITTPDGALHIGPTTIPLAASEHALGFTAGPTGDLAVLLALADGLTLLWTPPI
jgi:hypothetical protein